MSEIRTPFEIFRDADGTPLDGGYVYIGIENQEPITHPASVFWDAALTIAAAQPIRTIGGYPVRAGAPAQVYVAGNYSITVKNKNGELVATLLSAGTLEALLAAVGGAGLVGYDEDEVYPDGTVGHAISSIPSASINADAYSSIQAAIDAIGTTGGEIVLGNKEYAITSLSITADNVTIRGQGRGSVLRSSSTSQAILLDGCSGARIENLYLVGVHTNISSKGISLRGASNAVVSGCLIEDFGSCGVFHEDATALSGLKILDNVINNCGDFGVHVQGGDDIVIDGNTIDGNEYVSYPPHGIYVKKATNTRCSNNLVKNTVGTNGSAIELSGGTGTISYAVVQGNHIEDSTSGIRLDKTSNVVISGNTIKDVSASGSRGIHLLGANTKVVIASNMIDTTQGTGIQVETSGANVSTDVSIVGNHIDAPVNGIICGTAVGVSIDGNTLLNKSDTSNYTIFLRGTTRVSVKNNTITAGARHIQCDTTCTDLVISNNNLIDNPATPVPNWAIHLDSTCDRATVTGNNLGALANGYLGIAAVNSVVEGNYVTSASDTSRKVKYGAAAPVSGTWLAGDHVRNVAPSEQGSSGSKYIVTGWTCTVGGSPGTWLSTRALTGN